MSGLSLTGTGLSITGGSGSTALELGTTVITGGTNGRVLYDNSGTLGEMTTTGTGTQLALSASPSFTGTPLFAQGTVAARSLSLGNDAGTYGSGINANSSNELMWIVGGSAVFFTTFSLTRYARDHVWGWTSSQYNPETTALDTAFSRTAPGAIALGNGSAGNASGLLALSATTIAPATAPSAPASGWTLYCDSGDGNKLKAIASTGTIVTVGTP